MTYESASPKRCTATARPRPRRKAGALRLAWSATGRWTRFHLPTARPSPDTAKSISAGSCRAGRSRISGSFPRATPVGPDDPSQMADLWHDLARLRSRRRCLAHLWSDPLKQYYSRQIGRAEGENRAARHRRQRLLARWRFTEITGLFHWLGEARLTAARTGASRSNSCPARRLAFNNHPKEKTMLDHVSIGVRDTSANAFTMPR